jgi:hypothetical protein
MNVLLDSVRWYAREHPIRSHGAVSAGVHLRFGQSQPREELVEECCVLTRSPRLPFL